MDDLWGIPIIGNARLRGRKLHFPELDRYEEGFEWNKTLIPSFNDWIDLMQREGLSHIQRISNFQDWVWEMGRPVGSIVTPPSLNLKAHHFSFKISNQTIGFRIVSDPTRGCLTSIRQVGVVPAPNLISIQEASEAFIKKGKSFFRFCDRHWPDSLKKPSQNGLSYFEAIRSSLKTASSTDDPLIAIQQWIEQERKTHLKYSKLGEEGPNRAQRKKKSDDFAHRISRDFRLIAEAGIPLEALRLALAAQEVALGSLDYNAMVTDEYSPHLFTHDEKILSEYLKLGADWYRAVSEAYCAVVSWNGEHNK